MLQYSADSDKIKLHSLLSLKTGPPKTECWSQTNNVIGTLSLEKSAGPDGLPEGHQYLVADGLSGSETEPLLHRRAEPFETVALAHGVAGQGMAETASGHPPRARAEHGSVAEAASDLTQFGELLRSDVALHGQKRGRRLQLWTERR